MAIAFKAGRKPEPCLIVDPDTDVRLPDVPLNIRQPDVTVSRLVQIRTRRLTMENPVPLDVRSGELNLAQEHTRLH